MSSPPSRLPDVPPEEEFARYEWAFDKMVERGVTMIDLTMIAQGFDLSEDERDKIISGVHLGVAAAAEFYKQWPQLVPPP